MRLRSLFATLLIVCGFADGAAFASSQASGYEMVSDLKTAISKLQAFWIDGTTILIPTGHTEPHWRYALYSDPKAELKLGANGITGGVSVRLTPGEQMTPPQLARFPQLRSGYSVLHLPNTVTEAEKHALLRGQLILSVQRQDGSTAYVTGVQNAGVLDNLYTYSGRLGVVIRNPNTRDDWSDFADDSDGDVKVKVWAPTAQNLRLQLFRNAGDSVPSKTMPMHEHGGVWVGVLDRSWIGHYYLLDETVYAPSRQAIVENIVTDPYSIDLALNGAKSRLTDVDAAETKPDGWNEGRSPALSRINDLSIYELHVRDFSATDTTVPEKHRGTYLAFTDSQSDGMKHLRALSAAGLKAVHLLPTFHFNSVNEDKSTWKTPGDLSQYPPDGMQQQAVIAAIQSEDAYNWGYDPVHYLAPAGAYAVSPDDRVREYRSMVLALHRSGLRVIQDVVFNHTSGFGEAPNSILDKVVPNYYNRLDANGNLLTSTCCANTASEHVMMGKLQQDAIVWNAKKYKIDGFRFDLMGFTFVENLRQIKAALAQLTLAKDGVDGSKIYLYGEGWAMGEMVHNTLGVSATQLNLYGTGVGSFNDRLRDGVRGGSPAASPQLQGFATGLFTSNNSYTDSVTSKDAQLSALLNHEDWIRAGLAGNLRDFRFTNADGTLVTAAQIDYQGRPAGYTATPSEAVNYISVHDDQSLFDAIQIKVSDNETAAQRARRQAVALSVVALGQGIPFFMAGDDLLRSKDMDADSYDSGDWFNRIDWSAQSNNWGVGLPLARHNGRHYAMESRLLQNAALRPTPAEIQHTAAVFKEFLQIRYGSPLFRLATLDEVQACLLFANTGKSQVPGVIAMELSAGSTSDGPYRHILVIFNATPMQQTIPVDDLKGIHMQLHPLQANSADLVVRGATFDERGIAQVPALTTAVFVSAP
jgi:pullulanase